MTTLARAVPVPPPKPPTPKDDMSMMERGNYTVFYNKKAVFLAFPETISLNVC